MSAMGVALVALLGFLWIRLLTKKERAAKKYTEVQKQVDADASKISVGLILVLCTIRKNIHLDYLCCRCQTCDISW